MKPPPRNRKKPNRVVEVAQTSHRAKQWKLAELKQLLVGLKKQAGVGVAGELNYELLHKELPDRSVSEITSEVECLKNQVITNTTLMIRKNARDERRSRKPIEEWTHMASALAGTLEETLISAFYTMMKESSTKPHTVKSPLPQAGLTSIRPQDRTVHFRPMPNFPGQGKDLKIIKIPSFVRKTPLVVLGPKLQQPTTMIRVIQQPKQLLLCSPARSMSLPVRASSISTAGLRCFSPKTVLLPAHQITSPSTSTTPSLRFVTPPHTVGLNSPSASSSSILPARQQFTPSSSFSPTNNRNTRQGVKASVDNTTVDFNNIYGFISGVQKHSGAHLLTAMESAIVLDLLMSLPEELELLDCNNLKRHMIQMQKFLSGRADSKRAKQMYEDLKEGSHTHTVAPSDEDQNRPNVPDREEQNLQSCDPESHSAQSDNTSEEEEMMVPPLNPFMIPLDLLKHRMMELE